MLNTVRLWNRAYLSVGSGGHVISKFHLYSQRPVTRKEWCVGENAGFSKTSLGSGGMQNCVDLRSLRYLQTFPSESPQPTTYFSFRHDENFHVSRLLRSLPAYQNLLYQSGDKVEGDVATMWAQVPKQDPATSNGLSTIHPPTTTWRSSVNAFIDAAFASQDAKLTVTHPKNEEVVASVLRDIKLLSDEELCQVLYHIPFFAPCPTLKDESYTRIWKALDQECKTRKPMWSQDFCFVIADLWYRLNLARMSEFHWMLMKRLFRKCDKLSKEHYIRFLFCLNLNRDAPENVHVYDLEYKLLKIVDQLIAEEVVVIAVAFFKTQIHIRDQELLAKLLQIAMKSSETLDSVSVAAIAKLVRYCSNVKMNRQVILDFQEKFIPELPRLSITACTHLALVGTNSLNPHMSLIQKVVDRITNNIEEARLKELERISLAMTMFNADCDHLCKLVGEQLQKPERADEIRKYGRCLPAILHYLSIRNIFIPDLISTCLSKTFRDTYYGKGKEIFQRELLCLDIAADIELPEYTGQRLEPKWFNLIMKKNMMRLKPPTKMKLPLYDAFLRSVTEVMQTVLTDNDCFHLCNILPQHHTMAIVLCQSQDGQFVPIPDYLVEKETYEIKKIKPEDKLVYYALMLCGRNLDMRGELTGQGKLQVRQTTKLNYIPKLIRYDDWEPLSDSKRRVEFLENLLRSCKAQ